GVQRVFGRTRLARRRAGGGAHWRRGLLNARLHERVELVELIEEILPVDGGLVSAQVDPQGLRHGHDVVEIRDCVHGALPPRAYAVFAIGTVSRWTVHSRGLAP